MFNYTETIDSKEGFVTKEMKLELQLLKLAVERILREAMFNNEITEEQLENSLKKIFSFPISVYKSRERTPSLGTEFVVSTFDEDVNHILNVVISETL